MTWEEAAAFALSLPGTETGTTYGMPAVKVAANGRAFLSRGHEADTSFVLSLAEDRVELLKVTDPDSFWQTAHYEGWPAVLVRYDCADDDRVREVIAEARDWAAARPKARTRRQT
ncbi:MmcQ/YjbR family DNA-binding protein [Sphingomonas sp.]|uniref:MmcQ/YjbR family DNA-binding protein n=1 Tax=Sphingomonas sp. TaxID=28214 RepID=UPI0025FA63CF|nr:MmcQ/YjbR family DNA-binding protein [Sphingomonas sp.]MBV9527822.1 hypothetical protein [Sphingomonas sp.]